MGQKKIATGFQLSDWVWFWTQEFGAITQRRYGELTITMPIEDRWLEELDRLETRAEKIRQANEISGKKVNQAQDLLDSLLGPQLLKYASESYWETASYMKAGISYIEWSAMSLAARGRIIAFNRTGNAIDGLSRYATTLKSNAKARERKPPPPKKGK